MRCEMRGGAANMSYRKLEIWQLAGELTVDVHEMTL